ncbi:UNKNOWN [Stylonychia lemnae]|uniref:Cadg domain containing protein n=1 Tax=Stylonychia lemnae TaxID=5949 RepID=A0A078ADD1_STYLE|nr:UNKNOWN [Stylonychia lemnae]|eukprot:CDW80245.1 UNKNOWN [Stylonychia lemnae]
MQEHQCLITKGKAAYNQIMGKTESQDITQNLNDWCTDYLITINQAENFTIEYNLYTQAQYYDIPKYSTNPQCYDAKFTQSYQLVHMSNETNPDGSLKLLNKALPTFGKLDQIPTQISTKYILIKIINSCLTSTITQQQQNDEVFYKKLNGTQQYIFKSFKFSNQFCETVIYLIDSATQNSIDSSIFNYDNSTGLYTIQTNTNIAADITIYSLNLLAYYKDGDPSAAKASMMLKVNFYDCLTSIFLPLTYGNIIYKLFDPKQNIALINWTKYYSFYECGEYKLTPQLLNQTTNSFISFDQKERRFSIYTDNEYFANNYVIRINAFVQTPKIYNYSYYEDQDFSLYLISQKYAIANEGPPYFEEQLKILYMVVNQEFLYTLPQIKEPDNEKYTISMDLGQTGSFTKYIYPNLKFEPTLKNNGTYMIQITLEDSNINKKSTKYFLNVVVLSEEQASNGSYGFLNNKLKVIKSGFSPTLIPIIKTIDQAGLIKHRNLDLTSF